MSKFTYEATFRADLGKAIPQIGDLANEINAHLATAGHDEKLRIITESLIPPMVLTVDRELTKEEEYQVKTIIEAQVIQQFKQYDVRLVSFGRQSGHVSQEVA